MGSGGIAVCIGTPFDVALVRMQADSMKPLDGRRNYKNVFDAIGRIAREEGPKRCVCTRPDEGLVLLTYLLAAFVNPPSIYPGYTQGWPPTSSVVWP